MKQRFRASIGVFALCLFAITVCASASAQQNNPSVEQFWVRFKTAVQKSDKTSVASMSQFPIGMPYGVPKIRTRTQLARRWRDLFNVQANATKCFEDAKPVVDPAARNRFTVGCKNEAGDEVVIYGFMRVRSGWKLAYLDNINE
ncbi:MAG TPA: hypothetical protein VFX97_03440 [Pyrinomonadaceae bacterium]|nr:hypothetical protein [Pyrinomonadaceae bacterium]